MKLKTLALAPVLPLVFLLVGFQGSATIDRKQLKEMLTQLGYEIKDLSTEPGKEKYSFALTRGGLNVPIAAELSANGNFIWMTCFLTDKTPSGEKAVKLLQQNAEIQPTQFYATKSGKLMVGLPIENRGVTNAILRQKVEKLTDDVVKTQSDWQAN